MDSIRSFFGYIFLMTGGFLTITQVIIFPFSDMGGMSSGLGFGRLLLLFILTLGCVIGGMLGLEHRKERFGQKIATVAALTLSVALIIIMAGLVLTRSPNIGFWEYMAMLFYLLAFGAYGFLGTGAL
jgi:hypothetical protein